MKKRLTVLMTGDGVLQVIDAVLPSPARKPGFPPGGPGRDAPGGSARVRSHDYAGSVIPVAPQDEDRR
jgi:hypothetical protein